MFILNTDSFYKNQILMNSYKFLFFNLLKFVRYAMLNFQQNAYCVMKIQYPSFPKVYHIHMVRLVGNLALWWTLSQNCPYICLCVCFWLYVCVSDVCVSVFVCLYAYLCLSLPVSMSVCFWLYMCVSVCMTMNVSL